MASGHSSIGRAIDNHAHQHHSVAEPAGRAEPQTTGSPRRRLFRWGPPIVALFLICVPLAWVVLSSSGSKQPDPIARAAVSYSRQQIIWDSGPTVQNEHVVPMRQLSRTLLAYAPRHVALDVNIPALLKQYGPGYRVAVVVLHGSFNSLPPQEGLPVHDAVVLLNARTLKGVFLMD